MDRRLAAGIAVGAAGAVAVERLRNRPLAAAAAAAGFAAGGVLASQQPELMMALALGALVVVMAAG